MRGGYFAGNCHHTFASHAFCLEYIGVKTGLSSLTVGNQ
jgi:hypothetical protein